MKIGSVVRGLVWRWAYSYTERAAQWKVDMNQTVKDEWKNGGGDIKTNIHAGLHYRKKSHINPQLPFWPCTLNTEHFINTTTQIHSDQFIDTLQHHNPPMDTQRSASVPTKLTASLYFGTKEGISKLVLTTKKMLLLNDPLADWLLRLAGDF